MCPSFLTNGTPTDDMQSSCVWKIWSSAMEENYEIGKRWNTVAPLASNPGHSPTIQHHLQIQNLVVVTTSLENQYCQPNFARHLSERAFLWTFVTQYIA